MNLKTDIDLKHFFPWWGRELSNCLPESIRQKLNDGTSNVFLSVRGETIQFDQYIDGQIQAITTLNLNEPSSENFQKLIAENSDLEKAKYVLRLNGDQGIKKILYLPAVAKENLQQVVGFEMDRVTPFSVDQVYFAVKIIGKEEYGNIKVLLVVTPKQTLDSLCFKLKEANILPSMVDYSEAPNNYEHDLTPYNLLPEKDRPVKSMASQMSIWGAGILATLLLAAALVFPIWQQGQEVDSLRSQIKGLKKDTNLVQGYQLEIDHIIEETEMLIEIKNKSASMVEILNTLSQLLSDETWLTHFKFNNERLQIQGQSSTASALISILEEAPFFSNVRFVSPLTQDKKTGKERFQISMEVNSTNGVGDE